MSAKVTLVSVALLVTLASVSAVQRQLDSISDLRKIDFEQPGSKHILLLLHWFANVLETDIFSNILLTFDPDDEDYGSHHYGNYERLLNLPYGYKYYTVGNLNPEIGSCRLPNYVVNPPEVQYAGRNKDRILFGVRQNGSLQTRRSVDLVYITQHVGVPGDTTYDPERTYVITTNLLRQIRHFSVGTNAQSLSQLRNRYGSSASEMQLSQIRTQWGPLACLGLLLFIVIQERYIFTNQSSKPQRDTWSGIQQPSTPTSYYGRATLQSGSDTSYQPRPYSTYQNDRPYQETDNRFLALVFIVIVVLFLIFVLPKMPKPPQHRGW